MRNMQMPSDGVRVRTFFFFFFYRFRFAGAKLFTARRFSHKVTSFVS